MKKRFAKNTHRLAWAGLSFQIPKNWNISSYNFGKKFNRLEAEDDHYVRLEAEWMTSPQRLDEAKVLKRYRKAARRLSRAAVEETEIPDLPGNWSGFRYDMSDGACLILAFFSPADALFFAFVRIHFMSQDKGEGPAGILMALCRSFTVQQRELTTWAFLGISFQVPAAFRLIKTSLQAGRKLMVFQWRLRKLCLWHLSLADMLLKGKTPREFAVEFLRARPEMRGLRFQIDEAGELTVRPRRRYFLGRMEDLGRMCFRYRAACVHDRAKNQIKLTVFNYRRESDLEQLPPELLDLGTEISGDPGDVE